MGYDSTITFTLDTICPWTYIALARLRRALATHRTTNPASPVTFTLHIAPYQLYPSFPRQGTDKHAWYRDEKYSGSEARFEKYAAYMSALGKDEGIAFDFASGDIANSFPAHRVLQYVQATRGPEAALEGLGKAYSMYFEQGAHPSSNATLVEVCLAAGLSGEEAERVARDEGVHAVETRMAVQEQTGNGVDSVPYVVFEGRRRDFTLIGAKEVGEYEKILKQVVKEAM
ncbi:thioredoxin-like protein [Boeremia exigua]|uniref:thioredoxin-like protein n=1 Tax=Boeremia exigua TaxID=749465 RepID=UPI001E8E5AEC|nr:thioredoxin-like protein [Boeremia exigua]KAH6625198.1 thioredoxin-like protein [Boeremia exigua]